MAQLVGVANPSTSLKVSHLAEPAFHSTLRRDFAKRVALTGELGIPRNAGKMPVGLEGGVVSCPMMSHDVP